MIKQTLYSQLLPALRSMEILSKKIKEAKLGR